MAAVGPLSRGARTRRGWPVCVIAVLFALIASSAPGSATIIERYRSTQTYDEVRWDCGYAMRVVGVETHKVQVRADKKVEGIAYVSDNYDFKEVWTAADGRSFTMTANALAKDVKAKSLDGSVYDSPQTTRVNRSRSPTRPEPSSTATGGTSPSTTRSTSPTARSTSLGSGCLDLIPVSTSTCARPSHR